MKSEDMVLVNGLTVDGLKIDFLPGKVKRLLVEVEMGDQSVIVEPNSCMVIKADRKRPGRHTKTR